MKRKYMKKIVAETKFAEGLCLKKLFFVFLIGSVIGSLYEEILFLVQHLMATGELAWSLRRGRNLGPVQCDLWVWRGDYGVLAAQKAI